MSQASLAAKMPWTDHAGLFSPRKTIMLVALCLPFLWVVYLAAAGGLGNRPVTEAIHQTGDWAIRILLFSLLITPLRRLARWSNLLAVRRMVGVAAFAYAFVHFCLYIVDQKFALGHVAVEIVLRVYLTIGFITVLGLAALAITSTDDWQRRLGRRWQKLHNIVYWLAALGMAHYFMQSKVNVSEPLLIAGLFVWAMAWRRACRPPCLPSVMSVSTTGRRSLAFGSVVTICSCLINAAAMLANIASRCSAVRLNRRPLKP